jgi:hypothetical protein
MIRNVMPLQSSWFGKERSTIYNVGIYATTRKHLAQEACIGMEGLGFSYM